MKKSELKHIDDVSTIFDPPLENDKNKKIKSLPNKDPNFYKTRIKLSLTRALHNLTSVAVNIGVTQGPGYMDHFDFSSDDPKIKMNSLKYKNDEKEEK